MSLVQSLLIAALTVILLLFQNCSGKLAADGGSSLSSFCKTQNNQYQSPFAAKKVRLRQTFTKSQAKLTTENQKLSLVVDSQCLTKQNQEISFFNQPIRIDNKNLKMKKIALEISVDPFLSIDSIENEVDQTPCVLGLTENLAIRKSQSSSSQPVNDPQSDQQRHLRFVGYYDSRSFQSQITEKVVVAIVDTGVDYNHLELNQRMWTDANGNHGANFVNGNNQDVIDDDGHGTHLAGIIAAQENNSFGVAGLVGNYIEIMAVKSLNGGGSGTSQSVYNGIQYAIANGADIINLSLEAPGQNPLLEDGLIDAVNAGIVVTVATGNNGEEITASNLYAPAYIGPSINGVMSVASVDTSSAGLSFFSNYSRSYAEISAPGAETPSISTGGILSIAPQDRWTRIPGTSQAAPMVASAAAIIIGYLKTNNIQYTPGAIESFIKTDGSAINSNLVDAVDQGRVVNIGFLSQNLETYSQTGTPLDFTGETTGATCDIQ